MKKYIRVFRNKEETMPLTSFQLAPADKQTNNTILDTPENVYGAINEWMDAYGNGKVDFVWLTPFDMPQ